MAQPQETVLNDLKHAIGKYQHLGLSEVKAVSGNMISNYVVVCNTMKVDHELIGPHDAVRLVVNYNGKYKLLVYEKVLEDGEVDCRRIDDVLSRMNESSWIVCPGVHDCSSYKGTIGYDIKGAKPCSWPPNVARDVECQLWYHKDAKQQSNLCKACTQLKWKLSARKKEYERLSQTEKKQRSDASSRYPFEYLSPDSKQVKVSNMRKMIVDLSSLVKRAEKRIERLSLPDQQNEEIIELVQSIERSDEGRNELQKIFSEAELSGEGRGAMIKKIWDNDVSDMNQFSLDIK